MGQELSPSLSKEVQSALQDLLDIVATDESSLILIYHDKPTGANHSFLVGDKEDLIAMAIGMVSNDF